MKTFLKVLSLLSLYITVMFLCHHLMVYLICKNLEKVFDTAIDTAIKNQAAELIRPQIIKYINENH